MNYSGHFVSRRLFTSVSIKSVSLVLSFLLVGVEQALAIPSPELVIGSLSSVSQLLAVASAMLGGGAAAFGLRAGKHNNKHGKKILHLAIALLFVSLTSIGINIYQFSSNANAELARLQSTITRPAKAPGTTILDKNLKETSLKKQTIHPLGISSDDAAKLLNEMQNGLRDDTLFLDVRETGENEMGTLPGTVHIRFPDIAASNIDFIGKKVILMCHNGNRSSETCEKLAKLGIDCHFIKGGIEKWIVEGRPFTDKKVRSLSDLRAIPDYSGKNTLLDTYNVHKLVKTEGAQFIDVRYPGEFNLRHLPGAMNIPLRATETAQLKTLISSLPKRPIIAACYDRRGCFISQVLGLELSRAGYDFRGRYTLPWEYFIAPAPKPHITAWLASSQQGIWQNAVTALAEILEYIAKQSSMLVAMFALALASRILIFPISIKAERDQMIIAKTNDELAALKSKLKDDPKRMARAIQEFYAYHGLTPLRNLLALAFLPVMMLGLASVQLMAGNHPQPFLWVMDMSKPDLLFIWPVIFATLGCIYLQIAVAKTKRQKTFSWVIGIPIFITLAAIISAAGSLYLSISISLLLIQRTLLTANKSNLRNVFDAAIARFDKWRWRDGIIPLSRHELLAQCGNKSYRLSRLMNENIVVPDGVVLNTRFLTRFLSSPASVREKFLDKIWNSVVANEVAVRSSAGAEDGNSQSFAGVFESHLHVQRATLEEAILAVAGSFSSNRVNAYSSNDNLMADGNILIQKMIDAEFAGVLFTRDPEAPGLMMLEMVEGTADQLVSGTVAPELFRFGRYSYSLAGKTLPPINFAPLLELGVRAENLFNAAQDIEWTFKDGAFIIVQSRDITTMNTGNDDDRLRQDEWSNILKRATTTNKIAKIDAPLFRQDEMSEVLPRPTPISLNLMQLLWASGGSVDHACRKLGLSYDVGEIAPSRLITIFGRLYTDVQLANRHTVEISRACAAQLAKDNGKIAINYKQHILPNFCENMSLLESANFDRLASIELIKLFKKQWQSFVQDTHVEVEIINIAARFYIDQASAKLGELDIGTAQILAVSSDAGPAKALSEARKMPVHSQLKHLLSELGHRSSFDYELSEPRYQEQTERLNNMLKMSNPPTATPEQITPDVEPELPKSLRMPIQQAKLYQMLKEDAKHQSLRHLAIIRKLLMAIDRRFNMSGLCFHLNFDEILELQNLTTADLLDLARSRKNTMTRLLKIPPAPAVMSLLNLELATSPARQSEHSADMVDGQLSGTLVAGNHTVQGQAHVVSAIEAEKGAALKRFQDGDIIVCSMVHPNWLPFVMRSGGVVCDVGGWLSHIAIVAREHNISMIVGVKAYQRIPDGAEISLNRDGSVRLAEEANRIANAAE